MSMRMLVIVVQIHDKARRGHAATVDTLGPQLIAGQVQPGQLLFELLEVGPRVQQGGDDHVPARSGETVEIGYGHLQAPSRGWKPESIALARGSRKTDRDAPERIRHI